MKIKKHHWLWLIMLALLMIFEIMFMLISCNPTADFSGMSKYTVENGQVQNATENVTQYSESVKTIASIIPIIFITIIILGAVAFLAQQN